MFWIGREGLGGGRFSKELTVENAFRPSLFDISSDRVPGATLEAEQLRNDRQQRGKLRCHREFSLSRSGLLVTTSS